MNDKNFILYNFNTPKLYFKHKAISNLTCIALYKKLYQKLCVYIVDTYSQNRAKGQTGFYEIILYVSALN